MTETRRPWSCGGCDTRWRLKRLQHCPTCHKSFLSTKLANRHRIGPHTATGRRCRTDAELADLGAAPHNTPRDGVVWSDVNSWTPARAAAVASASAERAGGGVPTMTRGFLGAQNAAPVSSRPPT